jgi:hypothetical protein
VSFPGAGYENYLKELTMSEDDPISLEPDEPISIGTGNEKSAVSHRSFGAAGAHPTHAAQYKRPLNATGAGATRCRIFNSKVAMPSIEAMQAKINEWLDSEPIEVKHVGQLIGTVEGKIAEPNVLVFVWY